MAIEVSLLTVFIAAWITAITTGIGAFPLAFADRISDRWLSIGAAVASGLMLAASHSLIAEGNSIGAWRTLLGMAIGLVLIVMANRWMESHETPDIGDLQGASARKALLIVGVMTLHSFAEGVGVGVSYGGGEELGVFITTAIAIHNVPEDSLSRWCWYPAGSRSGRRLAGRSSPACHSRSWPFRHSSLSPFSSPSCRWDWDSPRAR